jgi:hypothetical protein
MSPAEIPSPEDPLAIDLMKLNLVDLEDIVAEVTGETMENEKIFYL